MGFAFLAKLIKIIIQLCDFWVWFLPSGVFVCVVRFFLFFLAGRGAKAHIPSRAREKYLLWKQTLRDTAKQKKITYNYTYIKYKINNENDFSFGNSIGNI